jgi:hypothetical protein
MHRCHRRRGAVGGRWEKASVRVPSSFLRSDKRALVPASEAFTDDGPQTFLVILEKSPPFAGFGSWLVPPCTWEFSRISELYALYGLTGCVQT